MLVSDVGELIEPETVVGTGVMDASGDWGGVVDSEGAAAMAPLLSFACCMASTVTFDCSGSNPDVAADSPCLAPLPNVSVRVGAAMADSMFKSSLNCRVRSSVSITLPDFAA